MNKKGQLTVFIILGIVILLVAGLGIYFYSKSTQSISRDLPSIAVVQKEAEPVSSFVTACLEKTLEDASRHIGSRGGVYDSSSLSYNFLNPTTQGTNAVQLSKDSKIVIPYWHYMSSDDKCDEVGKCELTESIPKREAIKLNLEKYVNKNIKTCLGEFEDFTQKGISVQELSEPKSTVYIQQNTVGVLLEYKLKVTAQNTQINLDKFTSKIQLNLNEILNLASTITLAEQKYSFLENLAKELISIYSKLETDGLPESETTFNSGIVFWLKSEVAEKMSRILSAHVPLLQAGGTRNYRYLLAPPNTKDPKLFETLYNKDFYIPLEQIAIGKDFSEFETKFVYLPEWKLYFDLNCAGELCLPDSVTNTFLFLFSIQKYNFAYDVSFPVMVEVKQPNAFDGSGYTFRFMLEANVRANQPVKSDDTPTKIVETSAGGDFCNPENFNSGKIKISAVDSTTKTSLDKAQVYFNCANKGCAVGETVKGVIESKLPRCLGGSISVFKENYDTASFPLDTDGKSKNLNIEVNPFKELEVSAKKLLVKKTAEGWQVDEDKVNIDSDEHVTVMIKKETKGLEQDYMTVTEIYWNKPSEKIRISPGRYEVTINSMLEPSEENAIIFPPQKKCVKAKVLGIQVKKECFNIPEQPMKFYSKLGEDKPLPNGKAKLIWTLTPEQLKDAKTVEFSFMSIDLRSIPEQNRFIQDFDQINKIDKYIKNSKDLLEVEIS